MMTQKEFDKFKQCVGQLPNQYYFVSLGNSRDYGLPFCKVMKRNTTMKETSISKNNAPNGVFIDVFVYNKVPRNSYLIAKQFCKIKNLKRILICRSNYYFNQGKIRDLLYKIKGIILKTIPKNIIIKNLEKQLLKYENLNNYYYAILYSDDMIVTFRESDFNQFVDINFENIKVRAVKEYDYFLKQWYGEYMQLPPLDEQIPHHFVDELEL